LELPNKLTLDGATWLTVQQHLYRGWGPFLGGPAEIGALLTTLILLAGRYSNVSTRAPTIVAAVAYALMIVVFFVLNAPVNAAVNEWTPSTLPKDWEVYRLQWELGHAIAALLSVVGLTALVRARMFELATAA
jgi:hypothetical protein